MWWCALFKLILLLMCWYFMLRRRREGYDRCCGDLISLCKTTNGQPYTRIYLHRKDRYKYKLLKLLYMYAWVWLCHVSWWYLKTKHVDVGLAFSKICNLEFSLILDLRHCIKKEIYSYIY
jgi:hypothetical protein